MKLTRKEFFAALFAPVLVFFGWKAAAPLRTTGGLYQFINTNIVDFGAPLTREMGENLRKKLTEHRNRMERAFMFGLKTTEMETPYGSFVMVENEAFEELCN